MFLLDKQKFNMLVLCVQPLYETDSQALKTGKYQNNMYGNRISNHTKTVSQKMHFTGAGLVL